MADRSLHQRRRAVHFRVQPWRLHGEKPLRLHLEMRIARDRRPSFGQSALRPISRGSCRKNHSRALGSAEGRSDRPSARRALDTEVFAGHRHRLLGRLGLGWRARTAVREPADFRKSRHALPQHGHPRIEQKCISRTPSTSTARRSRPRFGPSTFPERHLRRTTTGRWRRSSSDGSSAPMRTSEAAVRTMHWLSCRSNG